MDLTTEKNLEELVQIGEELLKSSVKGEFEDRHIRTLSLHHQWTSSYKVLKNTHRVFMTPKRCKIDRQQTILKVEYEESLQAFLDFLETELHVEEKNTRELRSSGLHNAHAKSIDNKQCWRWSTRNHCKRYPQLPRK